MAKIHFNVRELQSSREEMHEILNLSPQQKHLTRIFSTGTLDQNLDSSQFSIWQQAKRLKESLLRSEIPNGIALLIRRFHVDPSSNLNMREWRNKELSI